MLVELPEGLILTVEAGDEILTGQIVKLLAVPADSDKHEAAALEYAEKGEEIQLASDFEKLNMRFAKYE